MKHMTKDELRAHGETLPLDYTYDAQGNELTYRDSYGYWRECTRDAQGYGSALTYARRYSLMAACGIAPEDDDGNKATKSAPVKLKESDFKAFEEIYCIDMDELKDKYVSLYNRATTKDEQKRLTAIKDAKKIEIEKGVSE